MGFGERSLPNDGNAQQMVAVLYHRALESSLPDMAAGTVIAVVSLGVRNQQALHDAADARSLVGPEQKMYMICHQAIAEQVKRLSLLQVGNSLEKRQIVSFVQENLLSSISAIDHMIDQTISNRAKWPSHAYRLPEFAKCVKNK